MPNDLQLVSRAPGDSLTPSLSPGGTQPGSTPAGMSNDDLAAHIADVANQNIAAQEANLGRKLTPAERLTQSMRTREQIMPGSVQPSDLSRDIEAQSVGDNSALQNISAGVGQSLGKTLSQPISLVSPETGSRMTQNVEESYPETPGSKAGAAGQLAADLPWWLINQPVAIARATAMSGGAKTRGDPATPQGRAADQRRPGSRRRGRHDGDRGGDGLHHRKDHGWGGQGRSFNPSRRRP